MPLEPGLALFPGERIPREHWRDTAHRFSKPLLYAVTPQFADQAESLRNSRPATRVELFESAGHALFVDEADRFNSLLGDFISRNKKMPAIPD
jgi:microsomal epoxide hydrolase